MKRIIAAVAALALLLAIAGCSEQPAAQSSTAQDKAATEASLRNILEVQPSPVFEWSQQRQTLIDAEVAAAGGTQTTSFFFARGASGDGSPIGQCPSIGFPVPASWSLTNPDQTVGAVHQSSAVIAQAEPTGLFTGDSSGTYVVCVTPGGARYVNYVEADVVTVGGAAEFVNGEIAVIGEPTVQSTGR